MEDTVCPYSISMPPAAVLEAAVDLPSSAEPVEITPRVSTPIEPEKLHPALWLGHQLGRQVDVASSTGFAELDAELPGNGWPRRAITEVLLPHPGIGEMRLFAPALRAAQAGRIVMLFDPPLDPSASAVAALGIDIEQLLIVTTEAGTGPVANQMWALEQALKSGHVGAILAWLSKQVRSQQMRRLQLAAYNHDGAAFLVRDLRVRDQASAAALRLELHAASVDRLSVQILKRRGPLHLRPLLLELPSVLSPAARGRARQAEEAASLTQAATAIAH